MEGVRVLAVPFWQIPGSCENYPLYSFRVFGSDNAISQPGGMMVTLRNEDSVKYYRPLVSPISRSG